jgi:hypothetical protein
VVQLSQCSDPDKSRIHRELHLRAVNSTTFYEAKPPVMREPPVEPRLLFIAEYTLDAASVGFLQPAG